MTLPWDQRQCDASFDSETERARRENEDASERRVAAMEALVAYRLACMTVADAMDQAARSEITRQLVRFSAQEWRGAKKQRDAAIADHDAREARMLGVRP